MRWIALGVMVLLPAACLEHGRGRTEAAIAVVCKCTEAPLPKVQDDCIAKLTAQLDTLPNQLSEACTTCILANQDRCASIETTCQRECEQPQPPQPQN